jgi:hypothetical protein
VDANLDEESFAGALVNACLEIFPPA